jgi:hypothetical protein
LNQEVRGGFSLIRIGEFYGSVQNKGMLLTKADIDTVDANGIVVDGAVRRGKPAEREVALAVEYMQMQRPLKHPRWGSYGLKHWVETWAGEYIANGAVIVAALQMGLPVEPCGGDNPNCRIGLKLRTKPGERRQFVVPVPDSGAIRSGG